MASFPNSSEHLPSKKAIQAAQDIGQCDIVGLDAALSKIVAARQRPIVDVVVGWKDLPSGGDAGENYKEPSEFANILDIFVHINKEFFDADTIHILEKTSTEGTAEEHELLITSVASILCASLKKPKLVSIVDHQLLEKLEQSGNAKIQTILGNPERSVVIRDQMFQEEIKILEKMQNVISTQYSPEIKASVRTLLEYLERNHESLPPSLREVQTKLETGRNLAQLLEKINRYLSEPLSWNTNETSLLEQQLHRLKEGLSDFDLIQELDKQKDWLSSTQREILSLCIRKLGDKSNWSEIVRNDIFYNWIAWIEERNPEVKGSPFERYNQLRSQLMDLVDKKRILLARKLTMQLANNVYELKTRSQIDVKSGRRPKNFDHTNYSYGKIVNNFADELSKKRRVKPVRKLMQEYGSLVMKVGPCWLASPEVVSEVLPLERGLFDLIIVDEASQCAVERILPALYRGSRIVIVGDDKQLPPFDLFRLKEDESEYESELEQDETLKTESLLALAHRTYGEYYLTWHYRSKYQELIDFSNHAFYNGTLHIAPSLRTKSDDPPIKWVSCNGVWDERANREEASKVVDEIKSIWQKWGRKYSVGVITFNDKQRETIEDEIDSRMQNDPEFEQLYYNYSGENAHNEEETGNVNETAAGPIRTRRRKVSIQNDMRSPHTQQTMDDDNNEKLFVKNIENVQGHERDIIVFSIAYAKDTEGRPFRHHFGTLNSEGGENILNVAITRARLEVRIVCSIDPERDLHTDTLRNKGPKLFKRYLMYAKAIAENNSKLASAILDDLNPGFLKRKNRGMQANDTVIHTESIFEDQVLDALIARGYQVEPQLGYSDYRIDLAIRNPDDPDRFILAVECDGTTFHSAKSIRERDIARQRFLEQMGWKVERIWSRNWWHDPQRELKRIEQRIEELRKLPPSKIQPD